MATEPKPKSDELAVTVDLFVGPDARRGIAVAGLLADQPDLREAELTEADWLKRLEAYLATPRP